MPSPLSRLLILLLPLLPLVACLRERKEELSRSLEFQKQAKMFQLERYAQADLNAAERLLTNGAKDLSHGNLVAAREKYEAALLRGLPVFLKETGQSNSQTRRLGETDKAQICVAEDWEEAMRLYQRAQQANLEANRLKPVLNTNFRRVLIREPESFSDPFENASNASGPASRVVFSYLPRRDRLDNEKKQRQWLTNLLEAADLAQRANTGLTNVATRARGKKMRAAESIQQAILELRALEARGAQTLPAPPIPAPTRKEAPALPDPAPATNVPLL